MLEEHTFAGDPVEGGSLDRRVAVGTGMRPAPVVRDTEQDVGAVLRRQRQRDHHDHLIDMATGKVIEFVDPEIEALQDKIAKRLGYRLVGHRLELYGEPLDE